MWRRVLVSPLAASRIEPRPAFEVFVAIAPPGEEAPGDLTAPDPRSRKGREGRVQRHGPVGAAAPRARVGGLCRPRAGGPGRATRFVGGRESPRSYRITPRRG